MRCAAGILHNDIHGDNIVIDFVDDLENDSILYQVRDDFVCAASCHREQKDIRERGDGTIFRLQTHGARATIIDFGLSTAGRGKSIVISDKMARTSTDVVSLLSSDSDIFNFAKSLKRWGGRRPREQFSDAFGDLATWLVFDVGWIDFARSGPQVVTVATCPVYVDVSALRPVRPDLMQHICTEKIWEVSATTPIPAERAGAGIVFPVLYQAPLVRGFYDEAAEAVRMGWGVSHKKRTREATLTTVG